MAVTVIYRPIGYKLADAELDASISNFGGEALVTTTFAHGLSNGDYVFIQSNIGSYNGYKYVYALSPSTFKFFDSPELNAVLYVQDAEITYQASVLEHGVQAVHNPIVYDLRSNLYPVNEPEEAYTPTTVSSHADDKGYTKLILSGNLSDATPLAWITINDENYQIISVVSDSIVTINHAYNAADTFPGPVVKYYNNYRINVDVYAGFALGHPWRDNKPYQLMATISFIPDSTGRVKFSIADLVRSYIFTRNNLTLDTLPNNIDFGAQFCIEYRESWDESDGVTVSTHTEPTLSDCAYFQGLAINAMMPFKNQSINFMSDYVRYDTYLAKWLLLQTQLVGIVDKFMDLSFINHNNADLVVYINGSPSADIDISSTGIGVIRVPLTFDTAGTYCVQVYQAAIPAESGNILVLTAFDNTCGGTWALSSSPDVSVAGGGATSGYISDVFASTPGIPYTFTLYITISGGTALSRVRVALLDDDCNVLGYADKTYITSGSKTDTYVIIPVSAGTRVGVTVINNNISGAGTRTYEITGMTYDGSPGQAAQPFTEEICIEVLEECDDTVLPVVDDIRLLESGDTDYRLLE